MTKFTSQLVVGLTIFNVVNILKFYVMILTVVNLTKFVECHLILKVSQFMKFVNVRKFEVITLLRFLKGVNLTKFYVTICSRSMDFEGRYDVMKLHVTIF